MSVCLFLFVVSLKGCCVILSAVDITMMIYYSRNNYFEPRDQIENFLLYWELEHISP